MWRRVGDEGAGASPAGIAVPAAGSWRPSRIAAATGAWLDRCLAEDRDLGRLFLWLPVAFAAGVALYFAPPFEPPPAVLALTVVLAAAAAVVWRRRPWLGPIAVAVAATAVGAALAAAEVRLAAAPVIDRPRVAVVTGRVETIERRDRGRVRLVVRVAAVEGLGRGPVPARVAVTVPRSGMAATLGEGAVFRARLAPPQGPMLPGGYDPALAAWLDGIGATGFVLGRVEAAPLGPPPWGLRITAAIDRARAGLADRVRAALPGPEGEIAAALLVGERGAVPDWLEEAMRVSGLAHVLSISGLHMVLVAGTVMFAIRAGLALVPALALTRPIKLWAAAAAMVAATVYLVLSGAEVATQRAYVTLVVALVAVAVGRPAISLRNVAVAALVVMALRPSAVLGAGFQMSFAAVVALVAVYEVIAGRTRTGEAAPPRRGPVAAVVRGALLAVGGIALTSIVAGLATAPIAAYHFHRGAPLGLVANLAAMPFVSIVIMPAAVVVLALAPFGLEGIALPAMGWGIAAMDAVAVAVAGWSTGASHTGRIPLAAVLALVAALLWAAIAYAPWRRLAILPAAAGLALLPLAPAPAVLVSESGGTVAVRGIDGRLAFVRERGDAVLVGRWLAADADPRDPADPTLEAGVACDAAGCVLAIAPPGGPEAAIAAEVREGITEAPLVAVARAPAALGEDCARATVVVAMVDDVAGCDGPQLVLTPAMRAEAGVLALTISTAGEVTVLATARNGRRLWQQRTETVNAAARRDRREAAPAPAP